MDVLVFGESLIDLIQTDGLGKAGNPTYEACPGGSPFNAALALARQGVDVGYACPISTDPYGDLLHDRLIKFGASYAYPARLTAPTSLAVVSFVDGQPAYQFYRGGVADRAMQASALRGLPLPKWAQIGGLSMCPETDSAFWLDHMQWLRSQGVKISVDPNVRAAFIDHMPLYRDRLGTLCAMADVVKLSDEDAEVLFPEADPIAALHDLGVDLVAFTQGEQGAILSRNGAQAHIPVQPARPLGDTVGAGDTFGAALLSQVMAGIEDLDALGRYAATAARLNCQQIGCLPPTQSETKMGL